MQGFSPGRQIAPPKSGAKTKNRVQLNKSTDIKSIGIEIMGQEWPIRYSSNTKMSIFGEATIYGGRKKKSKGNVSIIWQLLE